MSELEKKLDIIIAIMAASVTDRFEQPNEKVVFLHNCGLTNKQIASFLGVPTGSVGSAISRWKAKQSK